MTNNQSLLSIIKVLQNLVPAVGELPSAKLENLAQWDELAPSIVQAAEAVSMALRERNPDIASTLSKVAADCAAMQEAMKADLDNPPPPGRIKARDQQILEMQAAVEGAL